MEFRPEQVTLLSCPAHTPAQQSRHLRNVFTQADQSSPHHGAVPLETNFWGGSPACLN